MKGKAIALYHMIQGCLNDMTASERQSFIEFVRHSEIIGMTNYNPEWAKDIKQLANKIR